MRLSPAGGALSLIYLKSTFSLFGEGFNTSVSFFSDSVCYTGSTLMMALIKKCPKCHCVQHCKKLMCKKCKYAFRKSSKSSVVKGSKESIHELPIEEAEARRPYYRQSGTAVQSTSELLKAAGERQARDRQRKAEKRSLETEK